VSTKSESLDLLPEHAGSRAELLEDGFDARYEELGKLGDGGYATVLRCRQRATNAAFAIKISHQDDASLERFRREIDEQSKLDHPNVVPIVDHGAGWYAMPIAQGSLKNLAPELSNDARLRVVDQVARGLGAAHQRKLTHRDVTPNNILRLDGPDETWAIADFGLVRRAPGMSTGPRTQGVRGTRGFVAPEVFTHGAHDADHRADIYSLGRTIGYMTTAIWPDDDEPLPTPAAWRGLVDKMTAKALADRFQSMEEVRSALAEVDAALRRGRAERWGKGLPDQLLEHELYVIRSVLARGGGPISAHEAGRWTRTPQARTKFTLGMMGLHKRGFIAVHQDFNGEDYEELSPLCKEWLLQHHQLFLSDDAGDVPEHPPNPEDIPF